MAVSITKVDGSCEEDLNEVIRLFRAYAKALRVDLTFQNFEGEMAAMPGKYGFPRGTLLLARTLEGRAIGCVGLCPAKTDDGRDGSSEMKRLYVEPEGRGTGAGKALVAAVVQCARELGYRELLLDSLPDMATAHSLYRQAGFLTTEPYYFNPHPDVMWFALALK